MNIIKKLFVNGKWSKLSKDALADDVSNSLLPPATAEDEGKVVSVTETGEYELSTVESGLPVATAEDAGKVVAVDDSGEYELAAPSGGATVLTLYAKDNDDFLYLNSECTQKFRNDTEAMTAVDNATSIVIKEDLSYRNKRYYPASVYHCWFTSGSYGIYLLANVFTVDNTVAYKPNFTPSVKAFTLANFHD